MINIMCVDDEPMISEVTKIFLERSGDLNIETFNSAQAALDRLAVRGYDAIISDFDMPMMDGIELLKKVRANGYDMPFLLFTGKGREEVAIEALNNGVDFYIQKGGDVKVQFVELEHKLRHAVKRKQAEDALSIVERHEKFLVNIIRSSTQAFIVNYIDGGLGLPNNSFCELTGYSEEEVRRLNWSIDLTPDEWRETDLKAFRALDSTGNPQRYEREMLRKDGTKVPVEILTHVMKDETGEVRYYYSFINDISERKRAEHEVRQARTAMEMSVDGIVVIDQEGMMIFLNQAQAAIHGYTSTEELNGKSWRMLYDVAEQEKFASDFLPHLQKDGFWRGELVGLRKDGSNFPQDISLTRLDDGCTVCVIRDNSRMVQDNVELKRSKEELKSVFDNALVGIYRVSAEGNILMANPAMINMLGYRSFEDLANVNADDIYTMKSRDQYLKEIEEKGYLVGMETTWKRVDGKRIFIRDSIKAVRDENGNTLYYEGTVEDVSERRMVEMALQKANDKLSLLNSITRHDIINQLVLVHGYSDLIKERNTDERTIEFLRRIDRALGTIKRQIEFTRDYHSMGVKEPAWQDLGKSFENSWRTLDLPGIAFFTYGEDYEIYADGLFEKVFFNLIDNSIRHGGKVTEVKMTAETYDSELIITYGDNGVGISDNDRDKIFERGFGKNTGLGLFLVKAILDITQMQIFEEGREGSGARFVITVPQGNFRKYAK